MNSSIFFYCLYITHHRIIGYIIQKNSCCKKTLLSFICLEIFLYPLSVNSAVPDFCESSVQVSCRPQFLCQMHADFQSHAAKTARYIFCSFLYGSLGRVDTSVTECIPHRIPDVRLFRIRLFTKRIIQQLSVNTDIYFRPR